MMNQASAVQRLFDLRSLSLFSAIRDDAVLASLGRLLEALAEESAGLRVIAERWAAFAGEMAGQSIPLRVRLAASAAADENAFTLTAERGGHDVVPPALLAAAKTDLARLGRIAALDAAELAAEVADRLRKADLREAADDILAEGAGLTASAGLTAANGFAALAAVAASGGVSTPEAQPGFVSGIHPATFALLAAPAWEKAIAPFARAIRQAGAGSLGIHRSFIWNRRNDDGSRVSAALVPVRHPDPIRLADLSGYEDQRSVVISNTLRFMEGKAANNLLLYGDRGTGKSATVKAICNEYADKSLRLVEVRKDALPRFSDILEALADRAARFVVFVDDLTFEKTDDAYTGLKALLEGGAEEKPDNVVVYATSNRRHLVKERLADRPTTAAAALAAETGDVRAFDSMQEQLSLADRFGITVVYSSPNQDEYLRIAEFIAESRGLLPAAAAGAATASGAGSAKGAGAVTNGSVQREKFRADALRWERWFNGRSPRTARQYVDWIEGGEGFPWE